MNTISMNTSFPNKLYQYEIKLNIQSDILICELKYQGQIFQSNISSSDLKSGFVSLNKLHNIIKSNQTKTLPDFIIFINYGLNERTNINNLILNIKYSSNYVEFEETIYFKEKYFILNDEKEIVKLKQLTIDDKKVIDELKQIIKQQSENARRTDYSITQTVGKMDDLSLFLSLLSVLFVLLLLMLLLLMGSGASSS